MKIIKKAIIISFTISLILSYISINCLKKTNLKKNTLNQNENVNENGSVNEKSIDNMVKK